MVTVLRPITAHADPLFKLLKLVTQEALLTFVDSACSTTVLTHSPLSPASQHHLDSLLAHGEAKVMNSSTAQSSKSTDQADEPTFTLYSKLPPELQLEIWKRSWTYQTEAYLKNILYASSANIRSRFRSCGTRRDFLNTHGYVLFKKPGDLEGVFLHPEVDMLFITRRIYEVVGRAELVNAARESRILDKIRNIAIWAGIWDASFSNVFLDMLKEFSKLELVFIVVDMESRISSNVEQD